MASTVTISQFNRAPLGCGLTGHSHCRCATDKSTGTVCCFMSTWSKISEHLFEFMAQKKNQCSSESISRNVFVMTDQCM